MKRTIPSSSRSSSFAYRCSIRTPLHRRATRSFVCVSANEIEWHLDASHQYRHGVQPGSMRWDDVESLSVICRDASSSKNEFVGLALIPNNCESLSSARQTLIRIDEFDSLEECSQCIFLASHMWQFRRNGSLAWARARNIGSRLATKTNSRVQGLSSSSKLSKRSEESLERAMSHALAARKHGEDAYTELRLQGETINQAKKDLTEIDEKLSLSEKLIRGMGSLFGAFKNMFVRKRRDEREDNVENSSDVFGSQQVQKLLQDGESFVSFNTENVPENFNEDMCSALSVDKNMTRCVISVSDDERLCAFADAANIVCDSSEYVPLSVDVKTISSISISTLPYTFSFTCLYAQQSTTLSTYSFCSLRISDILQSILNCSTFSGRVEIEDEQLPWIAGNPDFCDFLSSLPTSLLRVDRPSTVQKSPSLRKMQWGDSSSRSGTNSHRNDYQRNSYPSADSSIGEKGDSTFSSEQISATNMKSDPRATVLLGQLRNTVGDIRRIAEGLGDELDVQNKTLDDVEKMTDSSISRIRNSNRRMDDIMR